MAAKSKYAISNVIGDSFWVITILMAIVGWVIALVGSILNNSSSSNQFPILTWWGLAFQAMVILLVVFVVLTNRITMYKGAVIGFLAVATVYSTNSTNNFVWRESSTAAALAAGQILLSIVNLLWIFFFGTTPEEPVHSFIRSFAIAKSPPDLLAPRVRNMRGDGTRARSGHTSDRSGLYSAHQYPMHQGSTTQSYPQLFTSDQLHGFETIDTQSQSHQEGTRASQPFSDVATGSATGQGHRRNLSGITSYTDQSETLSQPIDYIYKARALYSYEANPEDTNELSFEQDEILDISDVTGRWWQARRANGEVGICPSNYVVLLNP